MKVYLVGAGSGDPELLTIKALRLIKEAEIIIFDRLVSDEIMDLIPDNIPMIFAGKKSGGHYFSQNEINELLLSHAKEGKKIVRLKGGDPCLFGRGSEEAEFLKKNGVLVEIVPGISAASGCSASIGIPLTHRGIATSVRFVTGHRRKNGSELNWKSLADPDTTLVIYMGVATIEKISNELILAGLSPDTPAALIENGTTPKEKHKITTLKNLPDAIADFSPPTLIVIGSCCNIKR